MLTSLYVFFYRFQTEVLAILVKDHTQCLDGNRVMMQGDVIYYIVDY